MRKLTATATGLLMASVLLAQYDPDALAVLDAMSSKYKRGGAFKAAFTQSLTNKAAELHESISGDIIVKKEMYVLNIEGQKIFNNGKDIYNYNEELSEVTISPHDQGASEITIGNVYDLYKTGFKYALMSSMPNGDRIVVLSPEGRDETFFKITMTISARDELKSFAIYEHTGNIYTYSINSYEKINVEEDFFTFDASAHPHVEIIDFR